jgi:hypothetical protein
MINGERLLLIISLAGVGACLAIACLAIFLGRLGLLWK